MKIAHRVTLLLAEGEDESAELKRRLDPVADDVGAMLYDPDDLTPARYVIATFSMAHPSTEGALNLPEAAQFSIAEAVTALGDMLNRSRLEAHLCFEDEGLPCGAWELLKEFDA